MPPWERVRVVEGAGGVEDGNRVTLSVPFGPIRMNWVSRQSEVIPGRQFKDEQIDGPFAHWVHTHLMLRRRRRRLDPRRPHRLHAAARRRRPPDRLRRARQPGCRGCSASVTTRSAATSSSTRATPAARGCASRSPARNGLIGSVARAVPHDRRPRGDSPGPPARRNRTTRCSGRRATGSSIPNA